MKVKAAIYCRISRDAQGDKLGVDRQERECRALAERLGWEVVQVYVDNDISAYSGKVRPQYRAMLADVKTGKIGAVLAWHPDRLYRRAVDLEEIVNIAEAHHLQIATATAGDVNLSTPAGRMNARIIAAVAQGEVENTRSRVRSKKQEMAAQGLYRGGPRPYGFEKDGVTIREDEAQVIRDATKAILSGRSLKGVANELNAKGRTTSKGKQWTYMRLRDVLVRPRNAGLIHKGRADRRHESREHLPMRFEVVGKANWPAIVDEDTWRACATMLLDPTRRIHTSNEPRWLGSRSYVCGVEGCGALMRPTSKVDHDDACERQRGCPCSRRYYYRCSEYGHLSITAEKTDEWVRGVVAEMVRDPRVAAAMLGHDGESATRADRERRTTLMTRIEQLQSEWDDDLLTTQDYNRKKAKAEAEIVEIDGRLAEAAKQSTISPIFTAADPGAAFLAAPVDVQRAVLRAVLRVTVLPVAKRGDKWSDERLRREKVLAS